MIQHVAIVIHLRTMENPPQVEGISSAKKTEAAAEEVYETIEQAKEMDLPAPQAVELTTPSRDIKESTPESVQIEEAKAVNKKKLSESQAATLAKARAAKAEKRKLAKAATPDGTNPAPVPDPFHQMQEELSSLGKKWAMSYNLLQDLQKRIGYESPLQQQQVPKAPGTATQVVRMPSGSEVYEEMQPNHQEYPLERPQKRPRRREQIDDIDEMDQGEYEQALALYAKKNRKALNQVFYANPQMEERARQDPTMGHRPTEPKDVLFW